MLIGSTEDIQLESRFYRPSELATLFGIPLASIYYWIRKEEIRTTKIGSRYFVMPTEIARLMNDQKSDTAEAGD